MQRISRAYIKIFPLKRPIFVIGLNRSGTSFLTKILARTNALLNWTEANEMWDPAGYPWESNLVARPYWPLDPQGYTDKLLKDNGEDYYRSIPGICSMYTHAYGMRGVTQRFLNKCPMNTLRIDVLKKLFPDACFLGIIRDPRAVIRSWAEKSIPKLENHPRSGIRVAPDGSRIYCVDGKQYSRKKFLEGLAASYSYVIWQQLDHFKRLPEEFKYETRYEEFIGDIHNVIRQIDRKFGLDAGLRDWRNIPLSQDSRNVKYEAEFTREELEVVSDCCAPIGKELNYF